MLALLAQGAALGISAALSPGPFQSIIIAQTLARGWRQTLPIIFAPLLGDIPIAFVMVFILNQAPTDFLRFIGFAGAALLLYLARGLYKSLDQNESLEAVGQKSLHPMKGLALGLSMLFMSPGPYLYWSLILGPLLLSALDIGLLAALGFLFAFYLCSIGGLILISIFLSRIGEIGGDFLKRLRLASLILMVGMAVLLIAQSLRT